MVNGSIIGNIEVIAARGIILGIDLVQRKGYLRKQICFDRLLGPARLDLIGGNILDIIRKEHGDIFRRLVGTTEMHSDILRHYGQNRHQSLSSLVVLGISEIGRMVSILS